MEFFNFCQIYTNILSYLFFNMLFILWMHKKERKGLLNRFGLVFDEKNYK